jgi:ABC-type uncharacterized transport system permease subunit
MTTIAPLIFMYVFFDKNGEIKAIAPTLDEGLSSSFSVASFPLSDVEMFMTAKKNAFDYQVKRIENLAGSTYKLIKKQTSTLNYVKTLDSYLTKIEDVNKNTILIVTNNISENFVSLELTKDFKALYEQNTEDIDVTDFFNNELTNIYLTKRNNPYHLLFTVSFVPRSLLVSDILYFNYTGDYTNSSAYCKKLINGYGYKEKVKQ